MTLTLYDLLQVSPTASPAVIEASWKALQRQCHPDGTSPDSEMSRAINNAHDILSDPEKRKLYDRKLQADRVRPIETAPRNQPAHVFLHPQSVSLVDGLLELANRALDIFAPELPMRVTPKHAPKTRKRRTNPARRQR